MCIDIFLMCDMMVILGMNIGIKELTCVLQNKIMWQIAAMLSTKHCEMTQRYSPVLLALFPDKSPANSPSTTSLKGGYLSLHGPRCGCR